MPTHIHTCSLCEATCGIRVTVEAGQVTEIRGDPEDPFSQGHICPKAAALADLQHDPDRVQHPMKRTSDGWERVSWDAALDEIAERLTALQAEHGNNAMAVYQGNPVVHNLGAMLFNPALIKSLRTQKRFSATSVDQLPHMLASLQMFGHELLLPVPDVDRTDFLLILGANPLVSNGSIMTAPDIRRRLKAIQQRGGQVVVIDPRHTETARYADAHHFIRPGTDIFALLAMLNVIFAERGPELRHLHEHIRGLDRLRSWAEEYPPERVEAITGLTATTLKRLAIRLADTPRAVLYGRMGSCTQDFGGSTAMLINALNAVTGHLDTEGGLMFTRPALDPVYPPAGRPTPAKTRFGRWKSRVRGLPEFGGELPVVTLAEEILTPGDEAIRGLLLWAGNPVLSCPNGAQLDEALAALELFVSVDLYVNESNRHAHFILPVAPPLSRAHYDAAFNGLAVRNVAKYVPPALPAGGDVRQDWEVAIGLHQRLARLRGAGLSERIAIATTRRLGPEGLLAFGLRLGAHGIRKGLKGLSLRRLRRHQHGMDLGALTSTLLERMPRNWPSVDVCPEMYSADRQRAANTAQAHSESSLVLIGRRQLRSNNSWLHNSKRLVKGRQRCTLLIHPEDAACRSIDSGHVVQVRSRVGSVDVAAEVTDEIMRGVVSLPHGWGHGRDGVSWSVASEHAGVSINDLTDDARVDDLSGNAALSGTPVEVLPLGPGQPSEASAS